jgi:hypothetical protein
MAWEGCAVDCQSAVFFHTALREKNADLKSKARRTQELRQQVRFLPLEFFLAQHSTLPQTIELSNHIHYIPFRTRWALLQLFLGIQHSLLEVYWPSKMAKPVHSQLTCRKNFNIPKIQEPPPKGLLQFHIIDFLQGRIGHILIYYAGNLDNAPVRHYVLTVTPDENVAQQTEQGQKKQEIGEWHEWVGQPHQPDQTYQYHQSNGQNGFGQDFSEQDNPVLSSNKEDLLILGQQVLEVAIRHFDRQAS